MEASANNYQLCIYQYEITANVNETKILKMIVSAHPKLVTVGMGRGLNEKRGDH
ncbi:MAG TPA: hypothetical protein VH500_13910 [Nitrososphaeraceae archaeon]|jgi:UDP-N-acetyl-D-mannosaminuronic acid transferase (WecB/TagA/CpsF family)